MKTRNRVMAILITLVLAAGFTLKGYEDRKELRQLNHQLQQTQGDLAQTTATLQEANHKLAFLEASKARVQVTAYALTDDFGPDPLFSNNTPARNAYAVPKHAAC